MRRATAIITIAVTASVISGCTAAGSAQAPQPRSTAAAGPSSASTPAAGTGTGTDEGASPGAIAGTPPADAVEEIPVTPETTQELAIDAEVTFLDAARSQWQGDQVADPVLLGLGNDACSEREAGKPESEIVVVLEDSGVPVENNAAIVAAAAAHLCPTGG